MSCQTQAECNPKGWMEPAALIFSINVITHTTAIIDFTKVRYITSYHITSPSYHITSRRATIGFTKVPR